MAQDESVDERIARILRATPHQLDQIRRPVDYDDGRARRQRDGFIVDDAVYAAKRAKDAAEQKSDPETS